MKRLLPLLALLLALLAGAAPARAQAGAPTEPFLIELPAGDVDGFAVDLTGWTGHRRHYYSSGAVLAGLHPDKARQLRAEAMPGSFWLDRGHPGVRFRGAGIGKTHVRPNGVEDTIIVDRHRGRVLLEDLTVHCGSRKGVFFGLVHKGAPVVPEFKLEATRVYMVSDPPAEGAGFSTVWGFFGYQSDVVLRDVRIFHRFGAEHASYWHGFARDGLLWENVVVESSGSEQCKVANRPSECDRVATARIVVDGCTFQDWKQPGSWRGGGGCVFQGTGVDIVVRRSRFFGGAGDRSRALMIDDGGLDYYGAVDGLPGEGPANGRVWVLESGFFTGPGVGTELSLAMRAGNLNRNAGHDVVRSLIVRGSAFYGTRTQVQLGDVPAGKLELSGCNTPAIAQLCALLGYPNAPETYIPLRDRLSLVSEGLRR